jgi:hypothetical protein
MAYETPILDVSLPASTDLSASQFCAVVANSSKQAALPSGATVPIMGVLQNKPNAAGKAAEIRVYGITKLVTNSTGVTNPGDRVGVDSAGNCQTDTTSGHYVIGIALASGSSGVVVPVLLLPQGKN